MLCGQFGIIGTIINNYIFTFKMSMKLSLMSHFSLSSSNDRNSLVSRKRKVSILRRSLIRYVSNLLRRSLYDIKESKM